MTHASTVHLLARTVAKQIDKFLHQCYCSTISTNAGLHPFPAGIAGPVYRCVKVNERIKMQAEAQMLAAHFRHVHVKLVAEWGMYVHV